MRFQYSTTDPSQDEFDSLPRIPLTIRYNGQQVDVVGLVDSGATVSVLPYEIGLQPVGAGMNAKPICAWQAIWADRRRCHFSW